jgi:hypothetical protein
VGVFVVGSGISKETPRVPVNVSKDVHSTCNNLHINIKVRV